MRLCAFSDLHGQLPEPDSFPAADAYLLAGDVCPLADHAPEYQRAWLDGEFREWVAALEQRAPLIWCAGNHDFHLEQRFGVGIVAAAPDLPGTYLQDATTELGGLRIFASPHANFLPYWAFMLHETDPGERGLSLEQAYERIPEGVDVVLAHGPAAGYGDLLHDGVRRVGSPALADRLRELDCALAISGHIHEGYGRWAVPAADPARSDRWLANVSLLNERYELVNRPQLFEIEPGGPARPL